MAESVDQDSVQNHVNSDLIDLKGDVDSTERTDVLNVLEVSGFYAWLAKAK